MNQLPPVAGKIQSVWIALGTFLTILTLQGVPMPSWMPTIFSPETFQAIIQAVTAVFTFYQYVKGLFIVLPKPPSAEIKIMSEGDAVSYAINPFRITR